MLASVVRRRPDSATCCHLHGCRGIASMQRRRAHAGANCIIRGLSTMSPSSNAARAAVRAAARATKNAADLARLRAAVRQGFGERDTERERETLGRWGRQAGLRAASQCTRSCIDCPAQAVFRGNSCDDSFLGDSWQFTRRPTARVRTRSKMKAGFVLQHSKGTRKAAA